MAMRRSDPPAGTHRLSAGPRRVLAGRAADDADPALEDALARVRELSIRLWAVREVHRPGRGLLGRTRCWTCAQPYPCPTLRAAGPPVMPRSA